MLVRTLNDVIDTENDVDWTNGTSRRLVVARDELGFTVNDTYVRAGTSTLLRYDNHLEACYCIEGSGTVETDDECIEITQGSLYAPGKGEVHTLRSENGMRLVCVFNPALRGTENHRLVPGLPSGF